MSLRDSLDLIRIVRPDAGTSALEHEILAERASSLGAAEQNVAKTLAALATAAEDRPFAWLMPSRQSGHTSCSGNWSVSGGTRT